MPHIQYTALIQYNATLDIIYSSKQRMCAYQYSQLGCFRWRWNTDCFLYLFSYSGSMVVPPG